MLLVHTLTIRDHAASLLCKRHKLTIIIGKNAARAARGTTYRASSIRASSIRASSVIDVGDVGE